MKKKIILFILTIGISVPMFSQVLFDFSFDTQLKVTDGKTVGNITVTLNLGVTPIKYQIIEGYRIKGNVFTESEFTDKRTYTFKDLPEGKYLIKIVDEQDRMAWKPFEIKADTNTTN